MGRFREMVMRFSGLLWLVLVAVIGVSTPSGEQAHLGPVDEAISMISLDDEPAKGEAKQEEDTSKAPDYGSDSPKNDSPDAYHQIPNFVFQHMSEPVNAQTLHECQATCNRIAKCRSFSFRAPTARDEKDEKDAQAPEGAEEKAEGLNDAADDKKQPYVPGLCLWSLESIHYKAGWTFYTKAKDLDWEGKPHLTTKNFHSFPGLEYQESSYAELTGLKENECNTKCAKDPKCQAFSYNEEHQLCRQAGAGVHYDPAFTYYEKPRTTEEAPNANEMYERNANTLASQEKASKKSIEDLITANRKRTEKSETRKLRMARVARMHAEAEAKSKLIDKSEKKLGDQKDRLSFLKSQVSIKQAFDTGYFRAMGVAHEKKTKEIKLKAQEIKQKDLLAAKESFKKTGEFQGKKAASLHERKVENAEIGIQTTQEKLMKLSNQKLKKSLDEQASRIAGMGGEESNSLEDIKEKHKAKIQTLKDQIYDAQQTLGLAKTQLVGKQNRLRALQQQAVKDAADQKSKYEVEVQKITALTNAKIASMKAGN